MSEHSAAPVRESPGGVALVTGAGKRLGQAIAVELGRAGMRVVVHYNESREGAEETCRRIRDQGGDAVALGADLSSRDAARSLVDRSLEALGRLDSLVLNAASFERIGYDDVGDEAWDRSLELNLSSPFALVHRATPALRNSRGSIVFVTCASATVPFRNYLPYVVSKGALRQLMRTLALELAPEIRVNAVAPGTVLPPADMDPKTLERIVSRIPLGRSGTPEDAAEAVCYLTRAPFVTGQEIVVDGGRTVAGLESCH